MKLPAQCPECGAQIKVPPPQVIEKIVKEKCECGMTDNARCTRYIVIGVLAVILSLVGCCMSSQYFSTKQIELISEKFKVIPNDGRGGPNDLPYEVVPKDTGQKK